MEYPDPRVTIAASVMVSLQCEHPTAIVELDQTTSNCPVVRITTGDRIFHLTVTLARKQPS